jgi:hypothetical protein
MWGLTVSHVESPPAASVPILALMKISKRTRYKFADFCSDNSTLRPIEQLFESEDFVAKQDYDGPEGGQRRFLVASFHANIDFDDPAQQHRLLLVYLEAVDSWGRHDGTNELRPDAVALIKSLKRDGAPIDDEGNLIATPAAAILPLDRFDRLSQPRVLQQHLDGIGSNLTKDPAAAIGSSKELAESAFKFVLDDYDVAYDKSDDMLDLYKKAAKVLKINREAVPDSAKGSQAAQRILQNLATAVQSLTELRNELGLGHGKTRPSSALERHARLAFNASRTIVEFVLQTWHERQATAP